MTGWKPVLLGTHIYEHDRLLACSYEQGMPVDGHPLRNLHSLCRSVSDRSSWINGDGVCQPDLPD